MSEEIALYILALVGGIYLALSFYRSVRKRFRIMIEYAIYDSKFFKASQEANAHQAAKASRDHYDLMDLTRRVIALEAKKK